MTKEEATAYALEKMRENDLISVDKSYSKKGREHCKAKAFAYFDMYTRLTETK